MAIGSSTPHSEDHSSFRASPLHEFLLSTPSPVLATPPLRRRHLPPPIQSTPPQRQEPRQSPTSKATSKSLESLKKLGSRKKNRWRNQKELFESSPLSAEILDWDLLITPRPESAFLTVLKSPNRELTESISELLESMKSCDSTSTRPLCLGQDNLSPTDKGLRQNLRRCLYGKDEMILFEHQIRDWIQSISYDSSKYSTSNLSTFRRSYTVEDKLMRLLIHALCRFYGLDSYSENDPLDLGKRKTHIVMERSMTVLPHETFCSYFYGKP